MLFLPHESEERGKRFAFSSSSSTLPWEERTFRSARRSFGIAADLTVWFALISCLCSLEVVIGQIRPLSPLELVEKVRLDSPSGIILGSTGTFGAPTYGEAFEGRLWFVEDADHTFCSQDYIARIKELQKTSNENVSGNALRDIFILRRGQCTFVTKVSIAQKDGNADCVIIVDGPKSWERQEIQHIIMADDGHGLRVTIPSILVAHEDGSKLIEFAQKKAPAIVKIEWSLPQKSAVRLDFWTDSGSRYGSEFLQNFADHALALRGKISFNTHYNVYGLPHDVGDSCYQGDPDFCCDPPEGPTGITGREVLMENLRQLCIWSRTAVPIAEGGEDKTSPVWWDYVKRYPKECPFNGPTAIGAPTKKNQEQRFGEVCSKRLMTKLKIDVKMIDQCVKSDWRTLLTLEKENKAWSVLALRINGVRFNGNLEPPLVSKAVCSAFEEAPAACKKLIASVGHPSNKASDDTGMSAGSALLLFLVLVGGMAVGLFAYQRFVRKSMRNALRQEVMLEVRAQMQEYHQMADDLPEDFRQGRPLVH